MRNILKLKWGRGNNMKTIITLLLLAITLIVSGQAPNRYKAQFDTLYEAVKTEKIDPIQPYLAAGYKLQSIPAGMEEELLPQLLASFPKVTGYEIVSETKQGENIKVEAKFLPSVSLALVFNSEGKIIQLNLVESATWNNGASVITIGKCGGTNKT